MRSALLDLLILAFAFAVLFVVYTLVFGTERQASELGLWMQRALPLVPRP
jgi:uncharacterized membrane protein